MHIKYLYKSLNKKQKESLSSFFNGIAIGWFAAAFVTPGFNSETKLLTVITYIANMIGAMILPLSFLEDSYE